MTMKLTASRYRIRRPDDAPIPAVGTAPVASEPMQAAAPRPVNSAAQAPTDNVETDLHAIRNEGLTGRQLRLDRHRRG